MNYPNYFQPSTIRETIDLLNLHKESRVIAGGTDLVPKMRAGVISPQVLIDIKKLGLDQIALDGSWVSIGGYATHSKIIESPIVRANIPVLAEACRQIGSPPIRNRGTIGGNLVNASPAADSAPALQVLDASVGIIGKDYKEYVVPLKDFFIGPGKTVIKKGEIISRVIIKIPTGNIRTSFIKIGKRVSMAISLVSVAVALGIANNRSIEHVRIACGSVAPTPIRATKTEEYLLGKQADEGVFARAAKMIGQDISPIADVRATGGYRLDMTAVLIRRALTTVCQAGME